MTPKGRRQVVRRVSEATDCTTPRVNHSVNCALWVTMPCSRSISCKKCTVWWETWVTGKAVHVWGQRAIDDSLYLPLTCVVSLELFK